MRVYGIDFTSTPSTDKPLTIARCKLDDAILKIESLDALCSWQELSLFLAEKGSWIAGIDFPFGQPIRLITDLAWPQAWQEYVRHIASISKRDYAGLIDEYRAGQPEGEKEHFRDCDRRAGALSPMKMYFVPTGKMFHQGAPFLLASTCNVVPFRIDDGVERTVVESYPGLVARKFIVGRSYKHDSPGKQTEEHKIARGDIVTSITSPAPMSLIVMHYGFRVEMADHLREQCIDDPTGDVIDSALAAIQACWAHLQQNNNYGVPNDCNLSEGWIPDPETTANEVNN